MPIRAYLPTSGASFGPEALANLGRAFEDAIAVLEIERRDEAGREAVARFIIHLAEIDGGLDSAAMRDKAVVALGGSTYVAAISKDGRGNAVRLKGKYPVAIAENINPCYSR